MVKTEPVAVVEENRLPDVTAKENMVGCAGKMNARLASHDHVIIERNGRKSSLTPHMTHT